MSRWPAVYFQDVFATPALLDYFRQGYQHVVVITDKTVEGLYACKLLAYLSAGGVHAKCLSIPAGEASKTRQSKQVLEDQLGAMGCARDTAIIALGGGMITDLAGFVAATYCRGVPVFYLPTTLLAMVDAAIGGKTGVNAPWGKNAIGSIAQPRAIFFDTQFLASLPETEYVNAFSEIIKHALISDSVYFDTLVEQAERLLMRDSEALSAIIKTSYAIKTAWVQRDEKEAGLRAVLNLGHTAAHALEQASAYTIAHGQAVAVGLLAESAIAHQRGLLSAESLNRIEQVLARYGLPGAYLPVTKAALKQALTWDKKTKNGEPHIILLTAIGSVLSAGEQCTFAITESEVDAVIARLMAS